MEELKGEEELTPRERELIYGENREAAWDLWDGEQRWKQYLKDAERWRDDSLDPDSTEELDMRELQKMLTVTKAVPTTIPGGFE